jgi:peptide-methionine (R)-S-oxide reductase
MKVPPAAHTARGEDMADHQQPRRSASGYDLTPPPADELAALSAALTDEERRVLLHQGTERAFCGNLLDNKQAGTYVCRLCGLPLFRAGAKFESGTGWPSFTAPFDPDHVEELADDSHGMVRTEIRCRRCGGHLGHVFEDGPPPAGLRYCLNSVSLELVPEGAALPRRVRADRGGD